MNKEINQSLIFSLRPDVAIATSLSHQSILVFPQDTDYRGLSFFCIGSMETEAEKDLAFSGLVGLGCDETAVRNYLNTDALVGYGWLVDCVEYTSQAQWDGDREFHGIKTSLDDIRKQSGRDRLFGYVFQRNKFSQQPVEGLESIAGEYWKVEDIRQIYRCEELYKRPVAVLEG